MDWLIPCVSEPLVSIQPRYHVEQCHSHEISEGQYTVSAHMYSLILLLSIEQGFVSHVLFYSVVCKELAFVRVSHPEKGERKLRKKIMSFVTSFKFIATSAILYSIETDQ